MGFLGTTLFRSLIGACLIWLKLLVMVSTFWIKCVLAISAICLGEVIGIPLCLIRVGIDWAGRPLYWVTNLQPWVG